MLASIPSATLLGASGHPVTVEVHVGPGLPGYHIVGLPDTACRESRDRVRAAVMSSELPWPTACITVNLAPSGRRKTGAGLDLAIAIGVLVASEAIPPEAVAGHGFVGELGLDGSLRRVPGVAPMVAVLDELAVVVPIASSPEAHVAATGAVRVASTLNEVVTCLTTQTPWPADPDPLGRRRSTTASRPGRCARAAGRPASPRDRRSRRPPPADGRGARLGQDDAGAAVDRRPAGTRPGRRAGGDDDPLGGRRGDAAGRTRDRPRRSGRRTTPARWSPWSAAARPRCDRARSASLTVASCSSTSSASFRPRCSTRCANRSRKASSAWPGRTATPSCRPASSSSPPPTLARAAGARRARASATTSPGCATSAVSPGRSSTGSTCASPCSGRPSTSCSIPAVASRAPSSRRAWPTLAGIAIERGGRLNAELHGELLDRWAPVTADARALLRSEIERERLTGRGYHRIRRVARTIADLHSARDGVPPPEALDVEHVSIALSLRTRLRAAAAGLVA